MGCKDLIIDVGIHFNDANLRVQSSFEGLDKLAIRLRIIKESARSILVRESLHGNGHGRRALAHVQFFCHHFSDLAHLFRRDTDMGEKGAVPVMGPLPLLRG